jgi:ADP-heptose:LPS heptosyltransferase
VNILLIRLRLIGDVVFTTPAIRALRRRFPDARLSYLVEPEALPVVRGNSHLDDVIVAPRAHGLARVRADLALARRLRAARFDLVIDFHGGPRSALLTRATGAARRVGYTVHGRNWAYTVHVPRSRTLQPRHSVENQWDLLAPLGIDPPDSARDATEMREETASAAALLPRLAAVDIDGGHELIVVHVSAGNPFRRWPAASFVHLIARLAEAHDRRRIVVTSGPSDAEAAARAGREARACLDPAAGRRIVTELELDLAGLRALIARAALFIGGDSGPLHVASTTATPVVGLYGPTLSARSAPWRDRTIPTESIELSGLPCRPCHQRRCEPGDYRCLGLITPEAVLAAADRVLARQRERAAEGTGNPAEAGSHGVGIATGEEIRLKPDPTA